MTKSLIILSGGLDSAVSGFIAKEQTELCLALHFDYGQRAAVPEKRAATAIAQSLNVPLKVIGLPWLSELGNSALTKNVGATLASPLPEPAEKDLDDHEASQKSAAAVWVPNRNGVFINVAAAFAESLSATLIVTGFNKEEAATFPDNSADFVNVANQFFSYSTQNKVQLLSYTQAWDKVQIVKEGLKRGLPFEKLWSCYTEGPEICRRCESCQRSIRAYKAALAN